MTLLPRRSPDQLLHKHSAGVDAAVLATAAEIVTAVRTGGEASLREHAERLGDIEAGADLVCSRDQLDAALQRITTDQRALLERTRDRIADFATAQRGCLQPLSHDLATGRAGHAIAAVASAGCYAPGGRYPLPSSVLMTAVTARVAGVDQVWVASPRPTDITKAAAAIADADGLLCVGGAQAIAALAYGIGGPPRCAAVVGPGNAFVTAAKQLVAGNVAIDMLAGPSELVILADADADPAVIAADLLAQAEHDPEAVPLLVSLCGALPDAVEQELEQQLADLPTAKIARRALANGGAVVASDLEQAIALCDALAPEHLQVLATDPIALRDRLAHWGGLFLGEQSAEVFGDYGAGPNHTLPTAGTARSFGGLSVFTFLRVRTWLDLDRGDAQQAMARDSAALARLEGLEAHARAAERRLGQR